MPATPSSRRVALSMAVVLALFCLSPLWGAGALPAQTYSAAEIGAAAEPQQIVQAPSGTLFVAGKQLFLFDGEHWEAAPIPGNFLLHSVAVENEGKVWVAGTSDLGWCQRLADGRWAFHSLLEKVPDKVRPLGEIWRVFTSRSGAVFFTDTALLRWDGERMEAWSMRGSRRVFGTKAGDEILVHDMQRGLFELTREGPRLLLQPELFGPATSVAWAERLGNEWRFGTSAGFFASDGHTLRPIAPALSAFVQRHRLTDVVRLHDGRLAVGTLTGGFGIFSEQGEPLRFFGAEDGLSSLYVPALFEDRDGALWIGAGDHIIRFNPNAQTTLLDYRSDLPRLAVRQIAKGAGRIIASVDGGVYELQPGERFSPVSALERRWLSLEPAPSGILAAGFRNVSAWDGSETHALRNSSFDAFFALPARTSPGEILISENRTVLAVAPNRPDRVIARDLPGAGTSLAQDANGRVWIGTAVRGVFVSDFVEGAPALRADGPAAGYGLPEITSYSHVRAFADGTIAVLADAGAWLRRPGDPRFTPVGNYVARPLTAVSATSTRDTLWVIQNGIGSANTSVVEIARHRDGFAVAHPYVVDGISSIGAAQCLFAETDAVDTAGAPVLWIGGAKGVLRHVVDRAQVILPPRAPVIRAFARAAANSSRRPIVAALPYDTRAIELEFATLEFSRRSALRLESRIDGIDHDWVPVDATARRDLPASRDGSYTVRARTVTVTGAASPETRFDFAILPPWWRTRRALAAELLALALLAYGTYRWRVRALERRNIELETKVRVRTEELERANVAKTQFVANMSHDLRNPLNGIVGLALALEDTPLDAPQRELVATMRECTTYLSSLVDDVLDFASIEAGRVELRPAPFSPSDLLQSALTAVKSEAAERGATITIETDPELPRSLIGDAGRIQQVLVNFTSNAIKYAGGEIILAAHRPAGAPGEIEFSVTDHGAGISSEEQKTLFTKFSRLEVARRDHIPGSGLGLAACRLLADLMGGSVGVVSARGEGACFTLRLPLEVAPELAAPDTRALPNSTVLLVEDTDYNALAATAVLRRLGLQCERARNGTEALQLFREKRFNVVLLDQNLPDMNGTDVARAMRELETEGSRALLLAVTAYCTAEDRQRCLDAGMDAFVGKPLTPDKLRRVLIAAAHQLVASSTMQVAENAPATPAPAAAQAAELNLEMLGYLADDSADGLARELQRFVSALDDTERELRAALAAGDCGRLQASAHRLRGHVRMIGGDSAAAVAMRLEDAARAGDLADAENQLAALAQELQALRAAVRHQTSSAQ